MAGIKIPRIQQTVDMPSNITGGVNITPESAGAGIGQAAAGLGQSIQSVGNVIAQMNDQDTKVAAADYQNQLQTSTSQYKEAFQNQYKESNAINKTKDIDDFYNNLVSETPSFFKSSPQRQQIFNSMIADSKANTLTWYAGYEGEQRAEWVKNVSKNIVDTGKQEAIKADDSNIKQVVDSYTNKVVGLYGNHDEATQKGLRESIASDLYEASIQSNMQSNPELAGKILDIAVKNELISPNIVDSIKSDIKKNTTRIEIHKLVDQALKGNPEDALSTIYNSTILDEKDKDTAVTEYYTTYRFQKTIKEDAENQVFGDTSASVEAMLLSAC